MRGILDLSASERTPIIFGRLSMSSEKSQSSESQAGGFSRSIPVAVLLLVCAALGFISAKWYGGDWELRLGWKTSQFFFNYQDLGFVKRGLVGSLIHPFPILHTRLALFLMAWSFVAGLAVLFARALVCSWRAFAKRDGLMLLLLCMSSPALFLRQGFDAGRFDALGLMAVLLSLVFIRRGNLWAAGVCSALALLTHEAYFVINLPLLIAYYQRLHPEVSQRDAFPLAKLLGLPCLVFAALTLFGSYEPGLRSLTDYFQRNPAFLAADEGVVNGDAIEVLTRGLGDNFKYNFQLLIEKKAELYVPVILAWGALMTAFFWRFHRDNALRRGWLFFSCFTPLLLSLIACDVYRWVALAATNMVFVIFIEAEVAIGEGRRLSIPQGGWTWLLFASCVLGPISNTKSFPIAFTLIDKVLPGLVRW